MRDYNDILSGDENKPIDMKSNLQSSRNGRNFSSDMPNEIFSEKAIKAIPLLSDQGSHLDAKERYKQALKDKMSDKAS